MPAKKKGTKRPTLKQRRQEKRTAIQTALVNSTLKLQAVRQDVKQAELLASVADGLYEELDKLAKKAPVDQVTDLVVEHVNDVVREVRELVPNDPYVQRIKQFVPAGDNPEHRDVVLVLKQLRQGLDRCRERLDERGPALDGRISTANGLIVALSLYIEHDITSPRKKDLEANQVSLSSEWRGSLGEIALDRIDRLDVESYFGDDE